MSPLPAPDDLADLLRERLEQPLPGPDAHLRMSPRPRHGWEPGVCPEDARQAAGLILLYPSEQTSRLVLTQRRPDLLDHGGQVSLPGGEIEPGETIVAAALREAWEEVALDGDLVTVLGRLTPLHIPVSNFVLHPVVGMAPGRPDLHPADREVARILEPRLDLLMDPEHLALHESQHRTPPPRVPYFLVEDLQVWGATAMVLSELLALLDAAPDPWNEDDVEDRAARSE